jgi:hypothetical protein
MDRFMGVSPCQDFLSHIRAIALKYPDARKRHCGVRVS